MATSSPLNVYDKQLAELKARHPGWRIWYVFNTTGPTTWCAIREPNLAEHSPEDLTRAIREVEAAGKPLP